MSILQLELDSGLLPFQALSSRSGSDHTPSELHEGQRKANPSFGWYSPLSVVSFHHNLQLLSQLIKPVVDWLTSAACSSPLQSDRKSKWAGEELDSCSQKQDLGGAFSD